MPTISRRGVLGLASLAVLAACSSNDPLATPSAGTSTTPAAGMGTTLVIGSQQYYSNEIIAELYAQVLENAGFSVRRQYQIGQREVYLAELEDGKVDVIPEYSGNLLQYYDKATTAKDPVAIQSALGEKLPAGLRVLKPAAATDQDSYNVTKAFAAEHKLTSLEDLKAVPGPLKVAANSEFATRPYGPIGLKDVYGVDVETVPVEDSAGPLTVKALKDGTVQLADLYTADPAIYKEGFVTLEDPKNLILPQNVTPLVSDKVDAAAAALIEKVNAELSMADLLSLNSKSVAEAAKSADLAREWLQMKNLI